MNPILLDAGVIVALLDRSERYHSQCIEVLSDLTGTLVTCTERPARLFRVPQGAGPQGYGRRHLWRFAAGRTIELAPLLGFGDVLLSRVRVTGKDKKC